MDLLFLLLFIFDGITVGTIVAMICKFFLGNTPVARLIKLLLSVASGGLYSFMCFYIAYGENDVSMGAGLAIMLAPLVIFIVVCIIGYMYKDEDTKK